MGKDLIEEKFVEDGASLEHERWARWQKYMFSKGTVDSDGIFHLPKEFVDRWFRKIDTPYSELSESEKESDRKETRNYLPLIRQALEEAIAEERKRIEGAVKKSVAIYHVNLDQASEHPLVEKNEVISIINKK